MRDGQTKVKIRESDNKIILPVIIKSIVDNEKYVPCTEDRVIKHLSPSLIISSYPVLVILTHQPVNTRNSSKESLLRILAILESLSINYLSIDDICGSLFEWCKNNESRNIKWNTSSIFTRRYTSLIFESLNKNTLYDIDPIKKLHAWVVISMPPVNLFEATFVPGNRNTILEWLNNILCWLFGLVNNEISIDRATLCMSAHNYKTVHDIRLNNMVDIYITIL